MEGNIKVGDIFGYEDPHLHQYTYAKVKRIAEETALCDVLRIKGQGTYSGGKMKEKGKQVFVIKKNAADGYIYIVNNNGQRFYSGVSAPSWRQPVIPFTRSIMYVLQGAPRFLSQTYIIACLCKIQRAFRSYVLRKRAAFKIQTAFKTAISDPHYILCKRRLMRELNESS